jgi:hypothetical protein
VPVADVAPSAVNGEGTTLSRWRGEAGDIREDSALKPPNPPRRRTTL